MNKGNQMKTKTPSPSPFIPLQDLAELEVALQSGGLVFNNQKLNTNQKKILKPSPTPKNDDALNGV